MGRRSTGRKLAMQVLHQTDVQKAEVDDIICSYLDKGLFHKETKEWASELSKAAWDMHDQSDVFIVRYSEGWEFSRINIVDKSILRIALYELRYTDTPYSVVIDEALELAKKYSTEDSSKFINGILATFIKKECLPE